MSEQEFRVNGQNEDGPNNELDIYHEAISPQSEDEFLDGNNLGLGNYENREYWQQVEAFKDGMYLRSAFSELVLDRAVKETIYEMGKEAWQELDPEEQAESDRRQWILEYGAKRWNNADEVAEEDQDPQKIREAWLRQFAGVDRRWTPPQMRMMMMRHEASRSRGARLLDNLFGRVSVQKVDGNSDSTGLLRRKKGRGRD